VNVVQLREKDLPEGELIDLARAVREVIARRALFFVNGSAAAASGPG